MISNSQCWVRERCKKANSCSDGFCIKLFKLNELCNLAMLTEDQKHIYKLHIEDEMKKRYRIALHY